MLDNGHEIEELHRAGGEENGAESVPVADVQTELVERLIDKHFCHIAEQEKNVMIRSLHKEQMEGYAGGKMERFTSEEPLFIFDCRGDGLNEGLVVTKNHLAYVTRYDTARRYELKDIKHVVKDKKMLTYSMFGKCFSGEYVGGIVLNGIRDVDAWIAAWNNFLLELNQPFKYEEREKKREQDRAARKQLLRDRGIAAVLQHVCEPYIGQRARCTIGAPLKSSDAVSLLAREKFGLEPGQDLFLIYDTSFLSNCSTGFVLCEQGLVYKLKHADGVMDWSQLKQCRVGYSMMELSINGVAFAGSPREGRMVVEILTQIQQMIS